MTFDQTPAADIDGWIAMESWIVDLAGADPDDELAVEWVLEEALDALVAYFAAKRGEIQ